MRCPVPSWLGRTIGVAICHGEGVALTVGDPEVVPAWTDLCRHREDASRRENAARLTLALLSTLWVAQHLLGGWILRLIRRLTTKES